MTVKLIAMNDFHGNIEAPAATHGGAVVLKDTAHAARVATPIKAMQARNPNNIVVGAGDMVGASPVVSTLTHDEASVDILNQIGLEVTSVGNHEFDHGKTELQRLQGGGYPGVYGFISGHDKQGERFSDRYKQIPRRDCRVPGAGDFLLFFGESHACYENNNKSKRERR